LTDTDDANGAIVDGKPAGIIYQDQGDGEIGVFVIPNTVAMIANCPHCGAVYPLWQSADYSDPQATRPFIGGSFRELRRDFSTHDYSYLAAADETRFACGMDFSICLMYEGADIVDVLRGIAIQNGVNIVPDGSVSGTVTIHLDNAPFEAGLRTLLETNGFIYEKQDSIYLVRKRVTTPETLQIAVSDDTLSIIVRRKKNTQRIIDRHVGKMRGDIPC